MVVDQLSQANIFRSRVMVSDPLYGEVGSYKRTVAPTIYPVTLMEAKQALQIIDDDGSMDAEIERLIGEATDQVERDARRCLMPQTWQCFYDYFPPMIELLKFPVITVNWIKYYVGGVQTTLPTTEYEIDSVSEPTRIVPVWGKVWPISQVKLNSVSIEWTAGYATPAALTADRPTAKSCVLSVLKMNYYGCQIGDSYWTMINRLRGNGFI